MSATAVCEEQVQIRRERRPCALPGGITLGQLLTRAHEDVQARGAAECPVCGGALALNRSVGRCQDCGSQLS